MTCRISSTKPSSWLTATIPSSNTVAGTQCTAISTPCAEWTTGCTWASTIVAVSSTSSGLKHASGQTDRSQRDRPLAVCYGKHANRHFPSNAWALGPRHGAVLSALRKDLHGQHLRDAVLPLTNRALALNDRHKHRTRRGSTGAWPPTIVNVPSYPVPYLLLGPPGMGKTATLIVGIGKISMSKPNSKILGMPTSNAAANKFIVRLLRNLPEQQLLRFLPRLPLTTTMPSTISNSPSSRQLAGKYKQPTANFGPRLDSIQARSRAKILSGWFWPRNPDSP